MIYLRLFWEFFKTGLFSVGGGLATLPFLYGMGEKTGWFTTADVADMLAVSESTPGGIGVNMATYAGYTAAGVPGGIIATLGLITPSILVILLVAVVLDRFRRSRVVQNAFYLLRPCSTALIAAAGLSVFVLVLLEPGAATLLSLVRWKALALMTVLWLLTNVCKPTKKLHPIVFIAFSALFGIVLGLGGA
ncbi:MAG: chromate transporter [Oscillospiraceae bacterium]|nr:chromate transporter [Oscillospiraceae bacterium]